MKIATKFVKIVTVTDPDTKAPVQVEIRKMEPGGMVGIDGSYLEQDVGKVYSPYDKGVELNVPDNERKVVRALKALPPGKPYLVSDRCGSYGGFATLREAKRCQKEHTNITNAGDVSIVKEGRVVG